MLFSYKQGKINKFLAWYLVLSIIEALSWLAFTFNWLNILFLILIGLISVILVLRKPVFALYLPLLELFWGSVGHSFEYGYINTRLVIFAVIVFIFLIKYLFKFKDLKIIKDKGVLFAWLGTLVLVVLGMIIGYFKGHSYTNIFFDVNAYGFLIYLPIWYQVYDKRYLKDIWVILQAAALIVAVKTLILFYFFVHDFKCLDTDLAYRWVRDSRTGEITPFANSFFRVFLKSQFYVVIAWLILFIKLIKSRLTWLNFFYLSTLGAAIGISLSRSFWLGLVTAIFLFFLYILIYKRKYFSINLILVLIATTISSVLIVEILFNIPKYHTLNIFTFRSTDVGEPAASSRMQMLGPLWDNIQQSMIIGHGWGKEVTYQSSDPKIRNASNPQGWYTTYSFELGWLDQWLKAGILFIACLFWWLLLIYRRAILRLKDDPMLSLVVILSLTTMLIIHTFSPYLNHPLGLGLLMLITIIYGKKAHRYY